MRFSFLAKNTIGLDISDRSIEVVEVSAGRIIDKARIELPPGILECGRIKSQEKLIETVRAVFEDAKIKNISRKKLIFGLPESQTFIHVFDIDGEKKDVESLVKSELSGVVPLESKEVAYGFAVQKQKIGGHIRVVAMAAERAVIIEWKKFLDNLGFSRMSIAAEIFASYVGLGVKNELLPIGIIDIGSNITMVGINDAGNVCFALSFAKGGDLATKKVAEAAGLSLNEAEKEKYQGGLDSGNEKVKAALQQVLDDIINSIKDCLRYFHESYGKNIDNLVLIGGTSRMPGLIDYFKTQIGLNVSIGTSEYLHDTDGLLYIEAVGLALYENNRGRFPLFDHGLEEEKSRVQKKTKKEQTKAAISSAEMSVENVVEENDESAKIKRQKIILLIILIVGLVAVASAFWYRSVQDKKHRAQLASQTQQFYFVHTLLLSVPVAVDPSEQTTDHVAGRIFESKVQMFGEKIEAIQTSRIAVAKQLLDGEVLWNEPLSVSSTIKRTNIADSKKIKNYTVRWLVYNETSANSLFTEAATIEMLKIDVAYSISNIEKKSLEPTENKNIYLLRGEVLVATDKQVEMLP